MNNIDLSLCGINIHINNNDVEIDLLSCNSKILIDDGVVYYNDKQISDDCLGQNNVVIKCDCDIICNCGCNK
jgi:hypothetical protein